MVLRTSLSSSLSHHPIIIIMLSWPVPPSVWQSTFPLPSVLCSCNLLADRHFITASVCPHLSATLTSCCRLVSALFGFQALSKIWIPFLVKQSVICGFHKNFIPDAEILDCLVPSLSKATVPCVLFMFFCICSLDWFWNLEDFLEHDWWFPLSRKILLICLKHLYLNVDKETN